MDKARSIRATIFATISIGGVAYFLHSDKPIGLIIFTLTLPSYYFYSVKQHELRGNYALKDFLPNFNDIQALRINHANGVDTEVTGARLHGTLKRMKGLRTVNSVLKPELTHMLTMVDKWGGEYPLKLIQSGKECELVVNQVHFKNRHTNNLAKELQN